MSEIRQRWRLVFARGEDARYLSHLDAVHSWERAFRRGEIPVATSEGFNPRPKLVFAAPLQLGVLAEHELADVYLSEKLTAPDLRERLMVGLPRGYTVVDLYDVWVNAPAIAPQLAAADYRMTLLNVEQSRLDGAVARLLAADELTRERRKEAKTIRYDLRPLIFELRARAADPDAVPPGAVPAEVAGLWMRLRHSQSGGSGRAEEVVAALAEDLGLSATISIGDGEDSESTGPTSPATESAGRPPIEIVRPTRERLWLAEELGTSLSGGRAG
ncbi:MAG TPA: TIGR03936 family radical SAM-associated protein [Candidatus Limnocylindrales bacterium]